MFGAQTSPVFLINDSGDAQGGGQEPAFIPLRKAIQAPEDPGDLAGGPVAPAPCR